MKTVKIIRPKNFDVYGICTMYVMCCLRGYIVHVHMYMYMYTCICITRLGWFSYMYCDMNIVRANKLKTAAVQGSLTLACRAPR